MSADAFLFWFLAVVTIASGLSVILLANPIYSALCLAMTMVGVSALFVTLDAFFIAGVQLIVYAGAVMVLFVMVLMLFDLKHGDFPFTRGRLTGVIKIGSVGMLAGLIVGAIYKTIQLLNERVAGKTIPALSPMDATKNLGTLLFSKYDLAFEALSILLLVVAIGAVALSRSKGGTHAKH